MSSGELIVLIRHVRKAKPKAVSDVVAAVEQYFGSLAWSLLKEEYEVYMTEQERVEFVTKLFTEIKALENI